MGQTSPDEITDLLVAWGDGDRAALERLVPLVHAELRRLARGYMRGERHGHTLQTTALVNEAYLKLVEQGRVRWQNRAHFLAIAARQMRHVLVDYARRRKYQKRGGGALQVTLGEAEGMADSRSPDLAALAEVDPRRARVVELKFFGGLTTEEAAEALGVSDTTIERDWTVARAWLHKTMKGGK